MNLFYDICYLLEQIDDFVSLPPSATLLYENECSNTFISPIKYSENVMQMRSIIH